MRMHGKVVLVTGAASAVGRAVIHLFANEGAMVYAADLVPAEPAHPFGVEELRLGATSAVDWARAMVAIVDETGRLDVLVNTAHACCGPSTSPLDMADWMCQVTQEQAVALLGVREAARVMRSQGAGSIVNVSSIAAQGPCCAEARGAALEASRVISKCAARLHAVDGIRVNTVYAGCRQAAALEVAYACLFLACDESSGLTGAELAVGPACGTGPFSPGARAARGAEPGEST